MSKLPAIEYPTEVPIKVMGRQSPEFRSATRAVVERHAGELAELQVTERISRDGNFLAVTYTIHARSREQLELIYGELRATGLVLYTL
jgi:hypothetical protein